ncbi:MAG: glycosyltransferase [Patescibacteria group bacterium]|nr:glycosyltransferase [Patescibacteria group bacterium]
MSKPIVAHISTTYLKPSETFIYSFVHNHKNYEPYIICEEWVNKEMFPTKNVWEMPKLSMLERAENLISKQLLIRNTASEKKYLSQLSKIKPNILLAHFGQIGMYATPLKEKLNVPLVTYFYGIDLDYRKLAVELGKSGSNKIHIPILSRKDYWRDGYKRLWEKGDAFLTFSAKSRAYLISVLGAPEEKVFSIPGGINLFHFKFKQRTLPENGEIKFVTVNRLVEKKGVEYAIKAMPYILKKYPKATYDIMGKGPLLESLQALVDKLGVGRSVKLLGFTPDEVLIKKLDEANVFLNPSVTAKDGDIEGWVNVTLMESIASGLPAIATYESGSETILPGFSGYICAERDEKDLAEKVLMLLCDIKKYEQMSRNCRSLAEMSFDAKKQTQRLEGLFDLILNSNLKTQNSKPQL